jgi:PAS domain S-box-containing protein
MNDGPSTHKPASRPIIDHPTGRTLLGALLALALLLPVWWLAGGWYEMGLQRDARGEAASEASLRANTLSLAINRRLARLQGLSAFVQTETQHRFLESYFETFAAGLYAGSQGIRNLAVAPGGVVRFVYPQEGNQALIGYEPLNDPRPRVRADAGQAIETGQVVLSGPAELLQGGQGLIAMQAIYRDDTFWGMVSVVLDMPTLLGEAGLDGQLSDLDFALRDSERQFIQGSPNVFESDPVVIRVTLVEGTWELAAVPSGGWAAAVRQPVVIFRTMTLIVVGLLTGLTYLSINRQARLAVAVRGRTLELSQATEQLERDIDRRKQVEAALAEREAQYRGIFESVSDGLLIVDLEGRLVDFNPAAAQMHGYAPDEFRRLGPAQFIHPDSLPLFAQFIEAAKAGEPFRGRANDLRQDGTPFPVKVIGTAFTYRGRSHALAVVRDVTEEVGAVELLEQRVDQRTRELATVL